MSTILGLDLVADEGNRLLARVDDADVLIGRAPAPKGVAIQSMALSATHGKFIRFNEHWFYRDLQSTNGTWFSSRMLSPSAFHVVKDGDVLILANTSIQSRLNFVANEEQSLILQEPTIFIFWQDRLKVALPLPRHGQSYNIGGDQSIVEFPTNFLSSHNLTIKADGRNCLIESFQVGTGLYHNSTQISPSSQILMHDRDNLITGQLVIVFSNGHKNVEGQASDEEVGTFIDPSARYSKKLITNSGFGKLLEEDNEAREVIRTQGIARPVAPVSESDPHNLIGDKIIYIIGILALIITLALLFWFLLA